MKNIAIRHNYDSTQFERKKRQLINSLYFGIRKNCVLTLFLFILITCSIFCSVQNKTYAQDENNNGDKLQESVISYNGTPVITLRFSSDIDANEQSAIIDAAEYWVSILKPTTGGAIFEVVKSDDLENNAAAVSLVDNTINNLKVTGVQSILADGSYVKEVVLDDDGTYRYRTQQEITEGVQGAHAQILIGTGWATTDEKSQSGAINNNLLPVLIHEIGHVLGMTTSLTEKVTGTEENPSSTWQFGSTLTRWDSFLIDNNGKAAIRSQKIGHSTTKNSPMFELGDPSAKVNPSAVTFSGTNAMKVLYDNNSDLIAAAGKTGGVPVTGYTPIIDEEGNIEWGMDISGSLSHINTLYSLLSWQDFRNYQGLIEVEMAVFKDLGYENIETRDFFGQSFYVAGGGSHGLYSEQQIANRGFGQWDGNSNSYDTSAANSSTFGIGVHLFGNNLNILQQGTINSSGAGSAGIRVDGVGNFLTIDSGSEIKMHQNNGIGLLVSFGKEHVIVHCGSISALSNQTSSLSSETPRTPNEIAASFDFGLQLFVSSDDLATDGISSYLRSYYVDPATGKKLTATNGPLVRRFDVTGALSGSRASIYISKTAHVEQINLMSGTQISGNIISYYNNRNYGTTLTFGLLPDSGGQAQAINDDNFRFVLFDHINYDYTLDPYLFVPTDGTIDIGIYGGITNFNSIRVNSRMLNIGKDAALLLGQSAASSSLLTKSFLNKTPYTRITSNNLVFNEGILAGYGEIRIGKWDFDDYDETTATSTTTTGGSTNYMSGWSEQKIAFWSYSIPGGDIDGYEQFFHSTDNLVNYGTISPGMITGGTTGGVTGDIGQNTIGQIDIHGGLTFSEDSAYNLTINGIPADSSLAEWGVDSDAIWVDGATIMKGTLRVFLTNNFQNELKNLSSDDPVTYHIIRSNSFTNPAKAKFTNLEYGNDFSDVKISGVYVNPYDSTVAQITLFPNAHYFEEKGVTRNTRSVGYAVDSATWDAPEIAFTLLGAKDDPATMNDVLHQIATDVRANSIMAGVLNPSRFLFPRIGWGNGQMVSGERGRIDWNINRERTVMNQLSQFRGQIQSPQKLRNGSFWFDYIGQSISSPSDGNSSGYRTYANGGLLGGEWNLTQHSAVGLAIGYANGATNSGRDKVRVNDYFMGLYFVASPFNQYEFKAYVGIGRQEYKMFHTIYNSSLKDSNTGQVIGIFDRYYGNTDGTTINTSYELTRPIKITERFILRPTIGVDSQYVWQGGFTEQVLSSTSGGLYTLAFDSMYLNHNMVRLGLNSESIGPRGSLWLRGFYNLNFGGHKYPTSRVRFTNGGDKFDIRGANIGWDAINLGAGFHLWLNADHSASFIFDVNTDLYIGNSGASSVGLRIGIMQNF